MGIYGHRFDYLKEGKVKEKYEEYLDSKLNDYGDINRSNDTGVDNKDSQEKKKDTPLEPVENPITGLDSHRDIQGRVTDHVIKDEDL